ncbi:AAA family ATPase [Methylovulum psychrotolerans]|uniref:AAA family ATPase n=1 Tax=Methylovulum psychrotolerans TaxID=1704499 RepID=UPI001BFF9E65|nr:AAA family ATPase [Methylovulum psychrotolerans]MBT9098826.1 AAA family ATPase [Methylovulum psychrotolerans]
MDYPVDNVDDAYNACNPDQPLEGDDERYLDLTVVRNGEKIGFLTSRITKTPPGTFHKQLFTGHRGSGKSTELHQLQKQLRAKNYFVVFLDIEQTLDLGEISYQDVLLSIAKSTLEALNEANISIKAALLSDLEAWFEEKIISKDYVKDVKASAKVTNKAGIKIPFVTELMTSLVGEIRSGSTYRTEIRQTLEKQLTVFIAKLNDLLLAARLQLQREHFVDFVVIVDGLEKMHYRILDNKDSNHTDLFIRHAEQLKSPQAHIVYTVPIALISDSPINNDVTDSIFLIPMVKYQEPEGKRQLIHLVAKRVRLELFADMALLERLIAISGGSVRDLLRLIRLATETTESKIEASDIDRAIRILVKDFDRLIREDDIPLLKAIAKDKRVIKDLEKRYERLLSLRLVNEYENGKTWADLHPVLRNIAWLQAKLEEPAP